MRYFKILLLLAAASVYGQQGGMWVPSLLSGAREQEMKKLGMKISAADIYDANKPGIKDAVPQFDGGCTAEVISPKGLLLTNHHCGYDAIQTHSSVDHDYLTDGFWAMSMDQELPNPGMTVMFVVRIEDVTAKATEGTTGLDESAKQQKIRDNIDGIVKNSPKENWQGNIVRPFFDGNQYLLFVTETFKDIRLVGAPPSSIGKFGSDTDNWVWPRHTGDFSMFRIYADKNNHPAEYAKDNVPYVPKHYFPVSIKGIKEGDFTMVMGYPGRTTEYLPAVAVAQVMDEIDPARIAIRDAALKVEDGFMRQDKAIKIQYASKYAGIANYWKKWIGEVKGLKKSHAVEIKKAEEKAFSEKVIRAGKQAEYGNLLHDFETAYAGIAPYALARERYNEIFLRNTDMTYIAFQLYGLELLYQSKGEQAFADRRDVLLKAYKDVYKDFNPTVDRNVFEKVVAFYLNQSPKDFVASAVVDADAHALAEKVYGQSKLTSYEGVQQLLSGDATAVMAKLNGDEAFKLMKAISDHYTKIVAMPYETANQRIAALQRTYMKAIVELNPDARLFPDANSTLRVTYGQVKGYEPADAITYAPFTYLDGVMEKYVPGDYEFDVPQKLIDLYNKKDYGRYGANGKMPVCFIGTNHTTGGNSGSPALDARGNLIGLNFDRVWEGTMSDLHYDPAICRNIMVDVRYVLFIIDKFAGDKRLIDEMKILD